VAADRIARRLRSLADRIATTPPPEPPPAPDPRRATTTDADWRIIKESRKHSLTSIERLQALIDSVRHVVDAEIPGAFAECGVWKGGSVLAMLRTLGDMGVSDRDVYLYDTFEGMTEPTEADTSPFDPPATETWQAAQAEGKRGWNEFFDPAEFGEEQVRRLLATTGYPSERLHFVRGPVEETIPATVPERLALLRLDTDWYESTLHEMVHLFPLLESGGVLIIDDYGHWEGARRAVDEYLAEHGRLLLTRIDYTARLAVKP
jgi:hypothetical protein